MSRLSIVLDALMDTTKDDDLNQENQFNTVCECGLTCADQCYRETYDELVRVLGMPQPSLGNTSKSFTVSTSGEKQAEPSWDITQIRDDFYTYIRNEQGTSDEATLCSDDVFDRKRKRDETKVDGVENEGCRKVSQKVCDNQTEEADVKKGAS